MSGVFDGKVAVVTGSGQGIGRAVALLMAAQGAAVVLNSRSATSTDQTSTAGDTAQEILAAGGRASAVFCDVGTAAGADGVIEAAIRQFGRLDILVNNAGGGGHTDQVENLTEQQWDAVIDSNLKSQFACSRLAVPIMKEARSGRIVNIGSNVGLFGLAGMVPYAAAKAGSIGLTFALAKELADSGVTVNCVVPSAITVRVSRSAVWGKPADGATAPPTKRTPEAIAPVVAYLCTEAAAGISGQVFYSAGGQITHYPWPPAARTIVRDQAWTIADLDATFGQYFGSDLAAPVLPRPLS